MQMLIGEKLHVKKKSDTEKLAKNRKCIFSEKC